jgi:hypothetical protein
MSEAQGTQRQANGVTTTSGPGESFKNPFSKPFQRLGAFERVHLKMRAKNDASKTIYDTHRG